MRLILLLGLLGTGLYAVALTATGPETARAPELAQPATEPVPAEVARADDASDLRGLPATVRRLADQPATGPARPVILQEAVIDPAAVQALQAPRNATATALHAAAPSAGFRRVLAESVNVRAGPSTGNPVVGRLARNEEVEVLERDPSGWVLVRIQGDGIEGWVAERLLSR